LSVSRLKAELVYGDVVDNRYRIEQAIGIGATAAVYRATDMTHEQRVALKVMHALHNRTEAHRRRFAREAGLLQRVQHPHVVRMLDFGHAGEEAVPYIAFELLRGASLQRAIRRDGAFDIDRVGAIGSQVLSALESAHAIGVIHRDIKPANIFLCQASGRADDYELYAKVLDFGLAKAWFGDEAITGVITKTGHRLGTPCYMSPEQVRTEPVGAASDLYSFGLVLGEMLHGKPVVQGEKQVDVLLTHSEPGPLPLPHSVLRSPFAAVIQRAVAKSPAERFRGAVAMRLALEEAHRQAKSALGPWSGS
jgi:serine/threonine-protein kinase